ncbi:tonsoku-like protein [Chiloscyllium plagiosum]|uniref:tonsoku-like protein n=1 Tax=Chiloscyllium plagiosum TaxID=36176 RepID=UPI001CB839C3|nr:tonsoku-like protein [Chiloscyllium plagiosum]
MGHPLTDRDNAGWTPLHEACNNGHVEIVQMLLDSGAPVNSVDDKLCGGVTALHDALQAGHLEIAELLIDRGANLAVQDFSGRSPADCFNQWSRSIKQEPSPDSRLRWESVSHILETGTPQLDTATQTAMGPELKPFSQRCQRSHGDVFVSEHVQLSSCSLSPDSTMTSCLQEQDGGHSTGAKLPQPSPTPTTQRSRKSLQSRKIQSSVGQRATTASPFSSTSDSFLSDESDDFMPFLIPFKKQHIHEGQSTASDHTYFTQSFMSTTTSSKTTQSSANTKKSSIKTTQSRKRSRKPLSKSVQSRMGSKKSSSKSVQSRMGSKKSSTNLVQSSVGLEESTSKHVQPSESSTLNLLVDQSQLPVVTNTAANGGQPPAVGSDWLDGNCSDDDWLEVDRSSRTQALSQPAQTVTVPVVGGSWSSSLRPGQDNAHRYSAKTAHTPTPSSLSHSGKNTMARIPSSCRVSRPSTSQPSVPSTPLLIPSFRVKVKVEKKCFVIGIPPSELDTYTISWLAEEAGRKYNIECGLRPRLSLTLDGALLSPHEPIVHLLRDNEVVLAEVVSWDLPPLSERYKTACDSLSLDANPSMGKILQLQEQGSLVDLSSLSLSKEHLSPILRALKLQTPTHQLCLSANRLGDDTMGELLACLVTMPNLRVLDLSSNQITHQGLSTLCQASRPTGEAAFQSLEELNLSLNPLGDGCSQSIASLIRSCPLLSTLKLQACGLTARFLQNFALACTMKGTKHLKTLILSNNDLGLKGVQVLLKNLPHDILSHLEISSIFCDQEAWQFLELVAGYLTQVRTTQLLSRLGPLSLSLSRS